MLDELKILLEKHLQMLSEVLNSSHKILAHAQDSRISDLVFEAENRERLINILSQIQGKIEELIENIKSVFMGQEVLGQLKTWQLGFNNLVEKIDELDNQIIAHLECQKDETTQEIAVLFKNKESFKGYNLQNVKK